jgi:glucose-1-phosphate cytidylyltransferase
MKLVILAGGLGSRLSEETSIKPKPMVEIGGMPIIWHIMKLYSYYGINDFIVCCGYKGFLIKEYFKNYFLHNSNITLSLKDNNLTFHENKTEQWKITLVDTGNESMTGGRLKRVKDFIKDDTFCMTYGDGLADVNIKQLIEFHKKHGRLATLTATRPQARFGALKIMNDTNKVDVFEEKPRGDGNWVNGGFFVLNFGVIEKIKNDKTIWETEILKNLSFEGELYAFKHEGFWMPMDTLRDKNILNELWKSGRADWKIW